MPPAIDERTAAEFTLGANEDAVEKVTRLLFDVLQSSGPGAEQRERNTELICRHPELARRRIAHVDTAQSLVSDLVAEKLGESDRTVTDGVGSREAAQMLVLSAGAIIRFAMRSSIAEPGGSTSRNSSIGRSRCSGKLSGCRGGGTGR